MKKRPIDFALSQLRLPAIPSYGRALDTPRALIQHALPP